MLPSDRFKLGLFSANCSGGMSITKVPERWQATWDDNLKLAHQKCHAVKTKQDVALIAEAKRREAKFKGAKRPSSKLAAEKQPKRLTKELPPRKRPLYVSAEQVRP